MVQLYQSKELQLHPKYSRIAAILLPNTVPTDVTITYGGSVIIDQYIASE